MKAIAILCLLEVLLIQPGSSVSFNNNWGGGEDNSGKDDPHVCLTDSSSCGCCMMLQQINKLEKYFNTSMKALEDEVDRTKLSLNNVRSHRAAFSVALTHNPEMLCIGPYKEEDILKYNYVFLNLEDIYDISTGVFHVPYSGVYNLALTVYSDAGSPGNTIAACVNLKINNRVVAGPSEYNLQDQEDSATIIINTALTAGDQVAVYLPAGCFLCDDHNHYNTFSGFLVYSAD